MRYVPAFLDLRGRTVLLVGEGEAADGKAALLAAAGAVVRRTVRFHTALLDGVAIAVGAGAPEEDLRALSAAARARGVPLNVVDRPELCTFVVPAIVDRDPVTVAISKAGTAPVLPRRIRGTIGALLSPGFGRLAELAGRLAARVRRFLPDPGARRRFLEAVLDGPVAELALAGRTEEAEAAFTRALDAADPAPAGMVPWSVPGRAVPICSPCAPCDSSLKRTWSSTTASCRRRYSRWHVATLPASMSARRRVAPRCRRKPSMRCSSTSHAGASGSSGSKGATRSSSAGAARS